MLIQKAYQLYQHNFWGAFRIVAKLVTPQIYYFFKFQNGSHWKPAFDFGTLKNLPGHFCRSKAAKGIENWLMVEDEGKCCPGWRAYAIHPEVHSYTNSESYNLYYTTGRSYIIQLAGHMTYYWKVLCYTTDRSYNILSAGRITYYWEVLCYATIRSYDILSVGRII